MSLPAGTFIIGNLGLSCDSVFTLTFTHRSYTFLTFGITLCSSSELTFQILLVTAFTFEQQSVTTREDSRVTFRVTLRDPAAYSHYLLTAFF